MTLIAGIDDAGRGPVIGPLVIAGVLLHDHQIPILQALGIKDSKALSPKRRQSLAENIIELAVKYRIVECAPWEIDEVVFRGKKFRRLNWLEAKKMAQVIQHLRPEIAYVDASDVLAQRFGEQISRLLTLDVEIISEHHADVTYPIVSAASILAKNHRDWIISNLKEQYGDLGSGYSSDPKTRQFLLKWLRTHEDQNLPDFVRTSWKTIQNLKEETR